MGLLGFGGRTIRELEKMDDGSMEGIIDFPLFNNEEIEIFIEKGVPLKYAKKCVVFLQKLPPSMIETLCEGATKYCETCRKHFADEGLSIPENISAREILQYIQPGSLSIMYVPEDGSTLAFSLTLNCDWEQEHGMEWFVKGGKALYVGPFNGGIEHPYDDEDELRKMEDNYV